MLYPEFTPTEYLEYVDDDGNYHREDGPAYYSSSREYKFYIHGRLHREDGPAVMFYGEPKWYYDGVHMSFNKWARMVGWSPEEIMIYRLSEGF